MSELCAGLGYAHSTADLRLVHRDVSPHNIFVTYDGSVRVLDERDRNSSRNVLQRNLLDQRMRDSELLRQQGLNY